MHQDINGGIDQLLICRSLEISPMEQVGFMEALYKESLPFDKDIMKTVKRIMVQHESDEYILYGKTRQEFGIVGLLAI